MKILIVDDDPVFRDIFASLLRDLGEVEVTFVESGREALHRVQESVVPFDCIFVDIQMPEMDGIELTGVLRVLDRSRRAQIIMVTSVSERHFIDLAFRAGADDYITKPLEVLELRARLGSIRRIHAERVRNQMLQQEIAIVRTYQHKYQFEDSIPLLDADGIMTSATLQNYVKTLGRLRQASSRCVGFHLENAKNIYEKTDNGRFARIVQEVAVTIVNVLKPFNSMIAYLGSGDFVGVTPAKHLPSPNEIEMLLNDELHKFADLYPHGCFPFVRVGKIVRRSLFSRSSLAELILVARLSAKTRKVDDGRALRRPIPVIN